MATAFSCSPSEEDTTALFEKYLLFVCVRASVCVCTYLNACRHVYMYFGQRFAAYFLLHLINICLNSLWNLKTFASQKLWEIIIKKTKQIIIKWQMLANWVRLLFLLQFFF